MVESQAGKQQSCRCLFVKAGEQVLSHFGGSWWSPIQGECLEHASLHRAVSSLQTMKPVEMLYGHFGTPLAWGAVFGGRKG